MSYLFKTIVVLIQLLGLAGTISTTTHAQIIPSSSDISYQLNPTADIHLAHRVLTKGTAKWVVLEVETRNQISFDSLIYGYAFGKNLNTAISKFNIVNLSSFELSVAKNKRMYGFELTEDKNYLILRIGVKGTDNYFTYIINLTKYANFFISKTNLTVPVITNYFTTNTPLKIAKLKSETSIFNLSFYSKNFGPSLPPMANLKRGSGFENSEESIILTNDSVFSQTKTGFYSIFEEEKEKSISFYKVVNKSYPRLSNINEIIEASVFLLTKKENDKLASSSNPKKDYDAFWLENTNSSERAGKMISAYFSRVKEANVLFTSFKEGWKTDMGMIYIIFGPPDKVFNNEGGVEWVYHKTYELPNLSFSFYLNGESTDKEYFELERNIKYQNTWFRAIDLWRKGRKNL